MCDNLCSNDYYCKGFGYNNSAKSCQLFDNSTANKAGNNTRGITALTQADNTPNWECYIKSGELL
jgi:hypothetical protein